MKSYISRLWQNEEGQSTTEYILILAVVVMVALQFKKQFQGKLLSIISKVGSQMEEATDP